MKARAKLKYLITAVIIMLLTLTSIAGTGAHGRAKLPNPNGTGTSQGRIPDALTGPPNSPSTSRAPLPSPRTVMVTWKST